MKTIAWDVDDVLNDLMRQWLEQWWKKEHPGCTLRYPDIIANPPYGLLGVSITEYLSSLDAYRLSPLYQQIAPARELEVWFNKHGERFRHIALTAVPLHAAPSSSQWVFKHFGRWIRTFHFVPSKRQGQAPPEYDGDKGGFLKWISKVDLLVDDNLTNIEGARMAGCKAVVMPRPWNGCRGTTDEALSSLLDIL